MQAIKEGERIADEILPAHRMFNKPLPQDDDDLQIDGIANDGQMQMNTRLSMSVYPPRLDASFYFPKAQAQIK